MKRRYVIFEVVRLGYAAFLSKSRKIQEMLAAPLFNSITPTPGEVMPLIDNLQALWNQTDAGNYLLKSERDTLRKTIESMMRKQCFAVNAFANGDMDILSVSGFEANKVPGAVPAPSCPIIANVLASVNAGEVIVRLIGSKHADYRIAQVRDKEGNLIQESTSQRAKFEVSGLPMDTLLNIRVQAHNANGKSAWSVDYPFMISAMGGSQNVFVMKPASDNGKKSSAA